MLPASLFAAPAASAPGLAPWAAASPLAVDPSIVLDAPASARALFVFLTSTAVGGAAIYRGGGRLRIAAEASAESLLRSALYGVLAYGLVSFLVTYGYAQLSRLGVGTSVLASVGAVALGFGLLALGGLGYAVVGTWVADALGVRDPWIGLLGVGLVGAAAVLVLPPLAGLAAWFGVAAVGIGGPVKRWVHADAAKRRADEPR